MKLILALSMGFYFSSAYADICGKSDDRFPYENSAVGKFVKKGDYRGCNVALVSKNCVVTMAECLNDKDQVEFNVPASILGIPQHASAEDIYEVDEKNFTSNKNGSGIGNSWAVVKLKANEVTGRSAGDAQDILKVISKKPKKSDKIIVVQHSYALPDTYEVKYEGQIPNPYGDVMHYAQQASRGELVKAGIFLIPEILEYNADTYAGSGGAPIINETTGELIGINTHGGCGAKYMNPIGARFTNSGTSIWGNKKFQKAILSCINSDK